MVDTFDSTNKVSTDNAAMVKLAFDTDQSASDVSFVACSDDVFFRQGVESSALFSLSASRS